MVFPVRPQHLTRFLEFTFLGLPRRLIIVGSRLLALANYETSFTLHLRLIFVPLYGDYTRAGRVIGLVFRLLAIVYGFTILLLLGVLVLISPVVWYVVLFGSFYLFGSWTLLNLAALFVLWWVFAKSKPAKAGMPRPQVADVIQNLKIRGNLELKALVSSNELKEYFDRLECDQTFISELTALYSYEDCVNKHSAWLSKSSEYLTQFDNLYLEPEQLFLAILSTLPGLERFLAKHSLIIADCEGCAGWLIKVRDEKEQAHVWQDYYKLPVMGGIGKGLTGRVTPDLDAVSTDFTQQVKKGLVEKTYWRQTEIERVADLLGGSNRNVLIIGAPGCGKTGIVKGIAWSVIRGTRVNQLRFKRIVNLEVGKILAGTKSPGDVAEKLKAAVEDALGAGDVIIFVDDIHTLIAGSAVEDTKTSSAYTVLTNYLTEGRLQFVGATSIENYRKYLEPNGSFAQLFQLVEIPPSSKEETLEILKVKTETLERQYKVKITFCALKKIVEMGDKLIHERVFPD
ncbi:AAA family ATPase, partial [Patescibacteria group bacterium]|nr:AAA family ATPase [Patescibacteria group bacterium]